MLAESTAEHRNTVRILFYGQSITQQGWTKTVVEKLKERFPHANIVAENRAIGGFAVPLLSRPAEHDVYPFYPDLIVFHVYGGEPEYEDLIREFRTRTTAEILIQNDHWTSNQANEWHDQHSWTWLPALCDHYGLEYCDQRTGWVEHLRASSLQPADLLTDEVHLNKAGEDLMAELVLKHLEAPSGPFVGVADLESVHDVHLPSEHLSLPDQGVLRMAFRGNRVDLIAANAPGGAPVEVWIDGKRPGQHRWAYALTRPSSAFGVWWPAVTRITTRVAPRVEDWTLTVTRTDDASKDFDFDVRGSVTGPDGSGNSLQPFASDSGQVVIEPGDWHTSFSREFTKKPMPVGYKVTWSVVPTAIDVWQPVDQTDETLEHTITLAQDMPNAQHTLELRATGPAPKLLGLRIYRPSVTAETPRLDAAMRSK